MSETGAIKFRCEQIAREITDFPGFAALERCRQKLRALGLIGIDAAGIGFGNLSLREGETNRFYITGSGSGGKAGLEPRDCAKVTAYDFAKNWIRCEGEAVASSESLTHAAVYEAAADARAVIHCHDARMWKALIGRVPTTSAAVEYGTPAMAEEVRRLFAESDLRARRLFAMAGHQSGIVSFGEDVEAAFGVLMQARNLSA